MIDGNSRFWLSLAKARSSQGAERLQSRKARAQESLSVKPPKSEETDLVHSLYLEVRRLKAQKDAIMRGIETAIPDGGVDRPIVKWMDKTQLSSIELMHPQHRNAHGDVFGGYIMKESFELAYNTAVCFFASESVHFWSMDDVQFTLPMKVGSIVQFNARVIFTDKYKGVQTGVVQVIAQQIDHRTGTRIQTNKMTFLFQPSSVTNDGQEILDMNIRTNVMPRDYDETVKFLEGRRIFRALAV